MDQITARVTNTTPATVAKKLLAAGYERLPKTYGFGFTVRYDADLNVIVVVNHVANDDYPNNIADALRDAGMVVTDHFALTNRTITWVSGKVAR
jgi:hypothetical protein